MIRRSLVLLPLILVGSLVVLPAQAPRATATVVNPIDLARPSETIVLAAAELQKLLAVEDVRTVLIRDDAANKDLLTQAIDLNDDGKFEQLIVQVDLAPRETRTLSLSVGARPVASREEYKAYGRFVRERRDDFAWENDRIAHRMYGAALETWAQEPLTSSSVDVWVKRVRRLVINDWYMVDDYHLDHGDGADLYSAGKSRGCGGNGPWVNGQLYPSANFRESRVIANGPIRVQFELTYLPWDASGSKVSEVKRVTLDAGWNLNRFESRFTVAGGPAVATHAIGIKEAAGSTSVFNRERGTLRTWESFKGADGQLGCGVIVDPAQVVEGTKGGGNYLVVAKVAADGAAGWYAGAGWSKSGDFKSVEDWDAYLEQSSRRLRAPVQTTLRAR
jgi:hypothetical protein